LGEREEGRILKEEVHNEGRKDGRTEGRKEDEKGRKETCAKRKAW
jgi:hypothetical protein